MERRGPLVVHLTTTDTSLELLLGRQLRAFVAAGYEVVGMSAPGPFVDALVADGVQFIGLRHASRAIAFGSDILAGREVYENLRMLRPDIVHTHNPKPGVYGRIAARAARVPAIVNTVHGLYAQADDRLGKRVAVYGLERIAALCSHEELVQNAEDLETLARLGVPRRKLHLLGNGVDLGRFAPGRIDQTRRRELRAEMGARDGDVVCGVVARLVWEKGYRELFAAAARLRARRPELKIVVVGETDPDKRDAVTAADMETAQRDDVRFLGHRHDVEDLYAAFDFYVLPSHREGFPRSAMEAAATALPIIATDIRGCRQVVDDGVTGRLVPRRDVRALADAIDELASDRGMRARMGAAALAKARREFDEQNQIDLTIDVYRNLLALAGVTAP